MPEALAGVLGTPGLAWIVAAAFVAGLVRGFSGFGTAMIFLPVAGQFLPPVMALAVLVIMDSFGPLPNLRRAMRDGDPGDIARLLAGTAIALPFGLALLDVMAPATFRIVIGTVSLALVAALLLGLRYRGRLTPPLVYGVGGGAGFLGGMAGVPGPVVVLFYMASPMPPAAIRANTMIYLFLFGFLVLALLGWRGALDWPTLALGLALAPAVVLGNVAGAAIFDPRRESVYRGLAYAVIAGSALSGLLASI